MSPLRAIGSDRNSMSCAIFRWTTTRLSQTMPEISNFCMDNSSLRCVTYFCFRMIFHQSVDHLNVAYNRHTGEQSYFVKTEALAAILPAWPK